MALRYERLFTDEEEAILKHDILDIKVWMDSAVLGKINNVLSRAMIQYREILAKEDATVIPLKERDAFNAFIVRPDYKNREQRDQDEATRGIQTRP